MWSTEGPTPRKFQITVDGHQLSAITVKQIFEQYRRAVESAGGRVMPQWEDRIWIALQKAYPRHIHKSGKPASPGLSLSGAVSYLKFVIRRGWDKKLVDPALAEKRAAICRECPMRKPVLSCPTCKDALQPFVNQPYTLDIPDGCGACGCWLPAKAWLARELLGKADAFPFWSKCWMRSE